MKAVRRPVLKPIQQDEAEQPVGDAAPKPQRAGELVVRVQGEEVARRARKLNQVRLRDQDAAGVEGQTHGNVFVVQRQDASYMRPAAQVDPAYARELAAAAAQGVGILVLQEKIDPPEITLASTLPFELT